MNLCLKPKVVKHNEPELKHGSESSCSKPFRSPVAGYEMFFRLNKKALLRNCDTLKTKRILFEELLKAKKVYREAYGIQVPPVAPRKPFLEFMQISIN